MECVLSIHNMIQPLHTGVLTGRFTIQVLQVQCLKSDFKEELFLATGKRIYSGISH